MAARGVIPALCATLIAAPAVLAQGDSIARCSISLSSAADSNSVVVAVTAAEEASVVVCDPDGPISGGALEARASAVASAQATAVASAIATATIDCFATGQTSIVVNGLSRAAAEAESIAKAFASAFASAEDCNRCQAAASFVGAEAERIWVAATAELEVELAAVTQPGVTVQIAVNEFIAEFVSATASAFASVLTTARVSAAEEGCSADVEALIVVDADTTDDNPPLVIDCEVNTTAISTGFAVDVVANATAAVAVFACENTTELAANITSKEVAIAVANAIAAIAADCTVEGDGFACVWANSSITQVVEACASAFALGYADAVRTCKPECAVNATAVETAIAIIIANATADAYLDQCAGPDSSFNITIIESQLVNATATAIASVIVSAGIDDGECLATAEANATIVAGNTTVIDTKTVTNTTTAPAPKPAAVPKPAPAPAPKAPPPPVAQPPPAPKPAPPPPPVKKPPPPPPVKKPPPPPPVVKPPPPPPVKPPPSPPPKKKNAPVVKTETTSSSTKTPSSSTFTQTSTTVVVDDPHGDLKPGTFVATTKSSATATVTESSSKKACPKYCAGDFMACEGSCCSHDYACYVDKYDYAQCLPKVSFKSYTTGDAKLVTCGY